MVSNLKSPFPGPKQNKNLLISTAAAASDATATTTTTTAAAAATTTTTTTQNYDSKINTKVVFLMRFSFSCIYDLELTILTLA